MVQALISCATWQDRVARYGTLAMLDERHVEDVLVTLTVLFKFGGSGFITGRFGILSHEQ
ncbi:hypothetical protein BDW22DRAFT_337945 [Trametopsis cervina]|nr:hypothetical protein BDW22DRAFT_337945 [Trametopsis cervina]